MKAILRKMFPSLVVASVSVTAAIAAVFRWYREGHFLYFWDSYVPLDIAKSFEYLYYNWHEHVYPGFSGAGWSWLPYWALISGFRTLTGSLSAAQGLLYFILLTCSAFFFYMLLSFVVRNALRVTRLTHWVFLGLVATSILYTYNLFTFFYGYFMFNPDVFIFSFLPLNMLALLRLFPLNPKETPEKNRLTWVGIFFLSEFLMTPGFSVYVFLAQYYIWLFLYLVLHVLFTKRRAPIVNTLPVVMFFIMTVLCNWWWLFPSLMGFKDLYASQSVLGTSAWFERGFIPSRLLNSMRLIGIPLMMNNIFDWSGYFIKNQWFTVPLFFIPFVIIYLVREIAHVSYRKVIGFLLFMYFVSLFIVKFSNPPLAQITKFAFTYIPFFGAFRDSYQKAGVFYMFALFVLFALGLSYLLVTLGKQRKRMVLLGVASILSLVLVIVTSPFYLFGDKNVRSIEYKFKGKTYRITGKTVIPPEYQELKSVLEPICSGTTVAVIPRSGWISSAIWPKYGTSYIGQDFLAQTIRCNFLTTVVTGTQAEANIEAPYIMLQHGNMDAFKNYLWQNNMGLVIIRKDDVPYFPTSWIYVDPMEVRANMERDEAFVRVYANDYVEVFRYVPLDGHREYGFGLTSVTVFTNSPIANGREYATLSQQVGRLSGYVAVNTDKDLRLLGKEASLYAPVLNCIGCVDVDIKAYEKKLNDPLVTQVKTFIKQLIGWNPKRPVSEVISLKLIETHKLMLRLLDSLDEDIADTSQSLLTQYVKSLEVLDKTLQMHEGDFFDVNQKYIEAKIYLDAQAQKLSDVLGAVVANAEFLKNTVMEDEQMRLRMYYLTSLLDDIRNRVDGRVFRTSFTQNVYRGRLDIPVRGAYVCEAYSAVPGIDITTVAVGNGDGQVATTSALIATRNYEKGSYPVSISYRETARMTPTLMTDRSGNTAIASLGTLQNGFYRLQFTYPSAMSNTFAILVTRGELDPSILTPTLSTDDMNNQVILSDTPRSSQLASTATYDHVFQVNSLELSSYYLYILPFRTTNVFTKDSIVAISVTKTVKEQDIGMRCTFRKGDEETAEVPTVTKLSPVEYRVTLPQGYRSKYLLFNQTYSPMWRAYGTGAGSPRELTHIRNVHANAWKLDSDLQTITVVNVSQKQMERNAVLAIVFTVVFGIAYYYVLKRHG